MAQPRMSRELNVKNISLQGVDEGATLLAVSQSELALCEVEYSNRYYLSG